MSKQEFILLIPAIVYGVAIVELLKAFKLKIYWETVYWGVYLLLNAVILWLSLFNQLDYIVNSNINLVLVLAQSILFAKSAELLTPEEKDVDTKMHFEGVIKYVILLQVFVFIIAWVNELIMYDDRENIIYRPLSLALASVAVFWQNKYYRWFLMAFIGILNIALLIGIIR